MGLFLNHRVWTNAMETFGGRSRSQPLQRLRHNRNRFTRDIHVSHIPKEFLWSGTTDLTDGKSIICAIAVSNVLG
jgi:hypothetical protein